MQIKQQPIVQFLYLDHSFALENRKLLRFFLQSDSGRLNRINSIYSIGFAEVEWVSISLIKGLFGLTSLYNEIQI